MSNPQRLQRRIGRVAGAYRNIATNVLATLGVFGVLVSMAAAWPAPVAQAAINSAINFQGKLVNVNGTNIPNGTYNLEFKLYTAGAGTSAGDPGGTLQWTEDWLRNNSQGVTVTDGIFQVNLGSITSLPAIFNNSTIWLSINLGNTNATCTPFTSCSGDGEMLPMIRFTASPYALNSDLLDGLDSSAFAQLSPGTAQSGFLNVTGNVTSGGVVAATTSLQAPLVDAATAVQLNIGTGTASSVVLGRTTTPYTIQGNSSSTFTATSGANTTTVSFTAPTANRAINFPDAGGTLCTTTATTCSATYQVAGNYLAKNAADTSSFAVTAANYLYGFTNSSSAVASGVLKLDNGSNTNSTLNVTASGNPAAGQALILANNTNGTPSGNLIDLQVGGVSKFAADASGNLVQAGNTTTTDTINGQRISSAANFTGTVTAATSVLAPLHATSDVASGTSANIVVRSGNATAGNGSSGNTTIDTGAKNGSGFAGNLYLGNNNAPNVNIGRNAASATGTAVSIQGLAVSSNIIVNDSTNTNKTTISFTVPTATRAISFPDAGGAVCLDVGNCDGATGGAGYILNRTGTTQTANFQISGTGRANNQLQTPLLDTPSGTTTLNIGTNNATAGINLNQNVTVASGKSVTIQGSTTQTNGAFSFTGNAISQLSTTSGALTITSAAAATWSTAAGDLTVTAAGNLNLGNGGGNVINIGTNAAAHTIAVGTDATTAQTITVGSSNSGSAVTEQAGATKLALANSGATLRTGTSAAGNTATALQVQNGQGATVLGVGTSDTNLILNPGAEAAFGGEWAANGSNTAVTRDTTTAWNGAASVKVAVTPSTGAVGAANNLGAALTASTAYTLSFYAKLKSGDPAFADIAAAYSRDGTAGSEVACSSFNTQTVVSGGWTRITCTFTTSSTAGNASAYIAIRQTAAAARTFYLDGVQLEQTNNVANGYGAGTAQFDAVVTSPVIQQNTENSTTALSVQNAAGATQFVVDTLNSQATVSGQLNVGGTLQTNTITPTGAMTVGAAAQQLTLQGNASTQLTATGGGFTTALGFAGTPVATVTYNLDRSAASGTYLICTEASNSCDSATGYLRKGIEETDNVTVASGHSLLTLSNSSSGSTGVLKIDNGLGVNSALSVTSAANLSASNATIFASNTLNNATGNLLDLQSTQAGSLASRFSVDINGNIVQAGGTSTTDTVNGQRISSAANFTGTVTEAGALTVSSGGAAISGNSTVAGTLGVSSTLSATGTGATELRVSGAPASGTTSSLVQFGGAALSSGSVNGTYVGLNTSGATTADLLNLENNNTSEFKVTSAGIANATTGFSVGGTSGANFGACGASQYVASFQSTGGIVIGGTCTALPDLTGFLAKNQTATETSSGGVAGSFYAFTNTNSTSSANVLTLTNSGTGNALKVTSASNPAAGNALVFASDTNATPSGNLLDLQAGSTPTSRFSVDASGNLKLSGSIDSSTGISIGTGTATSVTLGKSTTIVKTNGTAQIGNAAGSGSFVNNGSTVNAELALTDFNYTGSGNTGSIGSAASTVDIYTYISIAQTTPGQTLTIPAPSVSTTYGKLVYMTNTGTTPFSTLGSNISAGSSATLVWANVNGVGTWTYAGADSNGIQNQNSADQTANFRITGTGRANTSFAAPTFSSVDTSTASTNTGPVTFRSGSATGSTSNSGNVTVDSGTATGTTGTVNLGTGQASAVNIGHTGATTTANGILQVGLSSGTGAFLNNGSTVNSVYTMANLATGGWDAGGAAATVDKYTFISATQTTAGQTLTIPTPTASTTYGRLLYLSNVGTQAFKLLSGSIQPGATATMIWSNTNGGASWTYAGSDASGLQVAYNNSAGAAPSIALNTTNKALTLQASAASGIAAGNELFGVRSAAANDTTLGNSILTVSTYGLGINLGTAAQNPATNSAYDLQFGGSASRTIAVIDQATAATAGANLTVKAAAGNTSGAGGNLLLVAGAGGSSAAGGGASLTGGAAGGGNTNGGAVAITGGAASGSGTGGSVSIQGGSAAAVAGGAGGNVTVQAANGSSTLAGGVGGALNFNAGSGAGTGNNAGGNINLTSGAATGTGVPGAIIAKSGSNSISAFQVQNSTGTSILTVDTANGRVGIGTGVTAPAAPLEINSGSSGVSGLRFTQLTSTSTAGTTFSNILGLDANGNVGLSSVAVSLTSPALAYWDGLNNPTVTGQSYPLATLTGSATYLGGGNGVRLTSNTNGQSGSVNWSFAQVPFEETQFQFKAGGGTGADGTWFYSYADGVPTTEYGTGFTKGYIIYFSEYHDCVGITYGPYTDGNQCSGTGAAGHPLAAVSKTNIDDGNLHDVDIQILYNKITIRWDGVVILTYSDIYTRDTSALNFGFGARTGGSNNNHYITDLLVTKLGTNVSDYNINNVSPLASDLYWDNVNSRLGINTSSPTASLQVGGTGIQVGSTTTDATASLLVLDSYNNATDPTGSNGAMYYNTADNAFRCYQNGGWTNCTGIWQTLMKTADQTKNTDTVMANDSTLAFAMAANSNYSIRCQIYYNTNATADFKWATTGPSTPASVDTFHYDVLPGTVALANIAVNTAATGSTSLAGNAGDGYITINTQWNNGTNAGTWAFQWAQNTSSGNTSVRQGSYCDYASF